MVTMTRSANPCLRWVLVVAAISVTASCGYHATSSSAPVGTVTPGTPAASAKHATSPGGHARHRRSADTGSMIYGVIVVRSACPVDPVYHVCRPHSLGHVEVQARAGTRVLASAWTGADGRYALRVPPGRYVLVVMTSPGSQRCPSEPVSVGSHARVRADLSCGSTMVPLEPYATNA
jgi:hypothetical protein